MNNDTKRLAREWAERKQKQAERHWEDSGYTIREDTQAAIKNVLATTPPLTMADVEWEVGKHALTGATCSIGGGERVMIAPIDGRILNVPLRTGFPALTMPSELTPNGKHYELQDMTDVPEYPEPERPETLETVEKESAK